MSHVQYPEPPRTDGPPALGTRFRDPLFMILAAVVCGLAGGFGAVGFRQLIKVFQAIFFGEGKDLVTLAMGLPWYWRLAAPMVGGAFVGPLVYFFAREAKGHGVPEVMEAVVVKGGVIRPRVVAVKILASALCIGSGGSVGREGPIVQIGSALASSIGQMFKVSTNQLRTMVGCGAAAGIAATFNAPMAGALFATEIILGDFRIPRFMPIVISSVVATAVSRHFLGDFPAFVVPPYSLISPFELPLYMVVGLAAGLVGVAFIVILYATEDFFDWIPLPEYIKAALGGAVVGAIGIWFPQVFGVGYETINPALTGSISAGLLLILIFAKMMATTVTIGSGGSGGIFAPSLFMGAMTGGLLGTLIHQFLPDMTASSGAYALVAMGAVVAAATRAPITSIIIVFELTNDYTIIPPLMAACVVSTVLAGLLKQDTIYTLKLRRKGVDIFREEDPNVLRTLHVRDTMDQRPEVMPVSTTLRDVLDIVLSSPHDAFFVVDKNQQLMGAISLSRLRMSIFQHPELWETATAEDIITSDLPAVTGDETLDVAAQIMSAKGVEEIPVVDRSDPNRLLGSLSEQDVIKAYNREMSRRDLAGTVASLAGALNKVHEVNIGNDYVLAEVLTPRRFIGKTLKGMDVRVRHGIEVAFIRTHGEGRGPQIIVPSSDYLIREGDTLVVAGQKEKVHALEEL